MRLGNDPGHAAIPARAVTCSDGRPASSALADPAKYRLRRLGTLLMLAIAPGTAGAFLMVLIAAWQADHVPNCLSPGDGRVIGQAGASGQAALARRIRRRRSDERSSSFRPPQVPYFSGLVTA
jgi:hypothetical protein